MGPTFKPGLALKTMATGFSGLENGPGLALFMAALATATRMDDDAGTPHSALPAADCTQHSRDILT